MFPRSDPGAALNDAEHVHVWQYKMVKILWESGARYEQHVSYRQCTGCTKIEVARGQ